MLKKSLRSAPFRSLVGDLRGNTVSCTGYLEPHIPSKVSFFLWTAYRDKILAVDHLILRSSKFPTCTSWVSKTQRRVSHLLLLCSFTYETWAHILQKFGMSWIAPRNVMTLIKVWPASTFSRSKWILWNLMTFALCWTVWKEIVGYLMTNVPHRTEWMKGWQVSYSHDLPFLYSLYSWSC